MFTNICFIKTFVSSKNRQKKNKNFSKKIINKSFKYNRLLHEQNDIIINSDSKNIFSKKYFSKRIKKDYNSKAFTTIINHQVNKNDCAYQVFTKFGPLAFLPYSKNKTSVVFSFNNSSKEILDDKIKSIISKYNKFYKLNMMESRRRKRNFFFR